MPAQEDVLEAVLSCKAVPDGRIGVVQSEGLVLVVSRFLEVIIIDLWCLKSTLPSEILFKSKSN